MLIMATFTSSLEAIDAWRATRLPLARYLPLALLLAWAACGNALISARGIAITLIALGLVTQCRLWDDLVDRERDAARHPQRVLVRSGELGPFRLATALLGMANAIALMALNGWPHALGAALLFAALAGWYRWQESRGPLHALVLLLKYPVFVLLLALPGTWPIAAATVVYGAICLFEWLDTRSAGVSHRAARYVPFVCAAAALLVMNLGGLG
jgi:hypothetical protein